MKFHPSYKSYVIVILYISNFREYIPSWRNIYFCAYKALFFAHIFCVFSTFLTDIFPHISESLLCHYIALGSFRSYMNTEMDTICLSVLMRNLEILQKGRI